MFQLKNNLEFQGLQSSISLSDNELVYYGGLRSVRGFYELELFGNNVWILNSEIEFQPVSVLSMSLIYDYSIADISIGKNYTNSLGIGFGLVSRSSRLEIVVANGMLNDNPIDFSNTRIHIGFRSNF
jgi:hemolysin activation/secretion protein